MITMEDLKKLRNLTRRRQDCVKSEDTSCHKADRCLYRSFWKLATFSFWCFVRYIHAYRVGIYDTKLNKLRSRLGFNLSNIKENSHD